MIRAVSAHVAELHVRFIPHGLGGTCRHISHGKQQLRGRGWVANMTCPSGLQSVVVPGKPKPKKVRFANFRRRSPELVPEPAFA